MWKDLTLEQKAEIMKMSVANGVTDINAIQRLYDGSVGYRFDDGGFVNFYNSLPRNQRDSTNYNVRRYWELNGRPKDFNEAVQRGMYIKQSDGWHANSVAYNEAKDEYEFMKSPTHPTTIYEIGAYLNNKDFQKEYYLDYTSKPNYKYRRKPSWMYNNGGHLYKNAGPLNKKQAPKYKYGLIEQALVEGGAGGKFKVTSGKRKPNEAGNAGYGSAHTHTLENGDPAAIDIIPWGITGQELLDIMSSAQMQASLAKHGLDVLNESSKEMMAQTNATGQHLHVGKGIKGQQGKGQIFGGSTWGTLSGNTKGLYAGRGNSLYTSMPSSSTQSSEPFGVKAPKDEVNPWIKFLAEMQQSTRPTSPNQEEATNPTLTAQSNLTDFSSLNTDPRVEETIQQANSQPALAYMPDITSDPLWNDTYDLFEPNTLANGGHLFYPGGQMLLKDNAINPALQYVYGPEYETIVRQNRKLRTKAPVRISSQKLYNIEQKSDNTTNVVRPYKQKVKENVKAYNPKRQAKEQEEADIRQREYLTERQGSIGMPSNTLKHPDYDATKASEVQILREKEAQENKDAYFRRVAEQNILEGMEAIPWPSTIAGAYYSPNTHWYDPFSFLSNLYANDNRGFFNYNQITRDFYDENPEIGSAANLIGDFIVPGAAAKALKGAGRIGKFAKADIGNAWRTMRYELAHPEAQTLGIIPDRLNPFIGKKEYKKQLSRIIDLKRDLQNPVNTTLDLPEAKVPAAIHVSPTYRKGWHMDNIDMPYYEAEFSVPVPMEQGFNIIPTGTRDMPFSGETPVYLPDSPTYNTVIGGDKINMRIKNKLEDVSGEIQVPTPEGATTMPFPSNPMFSSPLIPRIQYGWAGERPLLADLDRIKMRGFTQPPFNPQMIWQRPKLIYPQESTPMPAYLPKDHPIRVSAKNYVDDLERRLIGPNGKPLATVEGSYRAVSEGLPHSPNDVEFLVPEGNVNSLKQLFGVTRESELPNGFGVQVYAPEFDELLGGSADFEVIRNGANGKAIGDTAWELYQYLHPREAAKLQMEYTKSVAKNTRTSAAKHYKDAVELPISAEELFEEYVNSQLYKVKYLYDTIGSPKSKHVARKNALGLGEGSDSKAYYKALVDKIHSETPGTKTLAEQGYKLDYTNIEANEKFLDYWGLPRTFAKDPEKMKIIVEQQMHAYQTVHRGSNIAIPGQSGKAWVNTPVEDRIEDLLHTNVDAGGGSASGPGGNSTNQINKASAETGLTRETEVIKQLPLTYKQEVIDQIKTPEDLVNRMKWIKDTSQKYRDELNKVNNLTSKKAMDKLSKDLDLPFYSAEEQYWNAGNYIGILGFDDIANGIRYIGDMPGKGYEIAKPFSFNNSHIKGNWVLDRPFEEKLYTQIMDAAEQHPEVLSALKRGNRLDKIESKIRRKRDITEAAEAIGKYGGLTVLGVTGAFYGLGAAVDKLNETEAINNPETTKWSLDRYKEELEAVKKWNLKKPDKNTLNGIESVIRYKEEDYNKKTQKEKEEYKQKIIVRLEEKVKQYEKWYKKGLEKQKNK